MKPIGLLVAAEPGQLPLGVLPGAELDLLRAAGQGAALQNGGGQLLVADGLHGGAGPGHAGIQKGPDLLLQAAGHHLVHPAADALPQPGPLPEIKGDGQRGIAVWQRPALPVVLGDGLARG